MRALGQLVALQVPEANIILRVASGTNLVRTEHPYRTNPVRSKRGTMYKNGKTGDN